MPSEVTLYKAELREIKWNNEQQVEEADPPFVVPVQFNPETLKVAFANQSSGGDQRGGAAIQFVGAGTTKLSLDLVFDATVPQANGDRVDDVRRLTQQVVHFIQPRKQGDSDQFVPPGLRFQWGTFLFDGIVDSVNETLEFFSEDGRPLRAAVSLSLSSQRIQFEFGEQQSPNLLSRQDGRRPVVVLREGETVQDLSARLGDPDRWPQTAMANGVENPRRPGEGTVIERR